MIRLNRQQVPLAAVCLSACLHLGKGTQALDVLEGQVRWWSELSPATVRSGHLTQPVKEHVEVGEHGAPGHLDDVVEGLTGVVAQPAVRVIEAGQHRLDQLLQVEARVLWWGRRKNSSKEASPQLPVPADIPAPLGGLRPLCGARFKDPCRLAS